MRLGAIFAGGQARRFGSDKAAAILDGVPLIEHVARALRCQTDALVCVGRDWPGIMRVNDVPEPGLGPLGALAGALAYAEGHGFDTVLTSGCDLPDLPNDVADRLAPAPAVVQGQPLVGLWPSSHARPLATYLTESQDRSMRSWIARTGTRRILLDRALANVNTPTDLALLLSPSADRQSSR